MTHKFLSMYLFLFLTLYMFRAHYSPIFRVTVTRGCIDTICLSWWWARCAWNM